MAKIIMMSIPAHGHTNPTLPVVKELIERGHQVIYYNGEEMRDKIEPTGVDFRPYPEPMPTTHHVAQALHSLIDATLMFIDMMKNLIPYMLEEVERESPDLIIYDSTCTWGYVVGRTLNIPHVCAITTLAMEGSASEIPKSAMFRHLLQALPHMPKIIGWKRWMNRKYGKEASGGIMEYGDLNIVFTSREFQPPNNRVDDSFRFVGPSINPATRDGDFPFDQLTDAPMVYISLGTVHNLRTEFYEMVFEAFADYPAQFVLSVGKFTDIEALGDIPANFIVRNYVPQLAILERADAFITHGGMNSVHEGLYFNVPEVVIPHQLEQLLNGLQVVRHDAGVMIGDKHPYSNVTVEQLKNALNTIMDDPKYRQHAERIGATLREAGGYLYAVDEIKAFCNQHLNQTQLAAVG